MRFIKSLLSYSFYLLLCLGAGSVVVISSTYLYLSPGLPDAASLRDTQLQIPLRIYDRNGILISEMGEQRRNPVEIEAVPPLYISALLAAEDDGFYEHIGIDIAGLFRAAFELASTGHIQSGGSTITMQVAKNYFLSSERTFSRKFNEILLALKIERELSKDEILELYVNKIFLGKRAYGIKAAAYTYYDRELEQLSLSELAMLAGLPKAPSTYNPIANPDRAINRRNWIIGRMLKLGSIDAAQAETAIAAPISAKEEGAKIEFPAPYIGEQARKEVIARYGKDAYSQGLKVFTTVAIEDQINAIDAVQKGLKDYDSRHGYRGAEDQFSSLDQQQQLAQLQQMRPIAKLEPAVITAITASNDIIAMNRHGEFGLIPWQQSLLNETRSFIDPNTRSKVITSPHDLWKVGDLVRVEQFIPAQDSSLPTLGLETSTGGDTSIELTAKTNNESEPTKPNIVHYWQLKQLPAAQAALVSLNPKDGAVLAMVGGLDYYSSKYNRVYQAKRQPGSNFKPFIYAAAFERGYTAASLINDAPIVFNSTELEGTWRPTNAGGRFIGPTRLRKALYLSRNLVSIRLLKKIGPAAGAEYVSRFGFDQDKLPKDLSLALGSYSVTPLQVARAFAAIANGGYLVTPYLISHIEDQDGKIIYQHQPETVCDSDCLSAEQDEKTNNIDVDMAAELDPSTTEAEIQNSKEALPKAAQIMDPRVAYIMDSILKDVIKKGTARKARSLKRRDIAGKTGTTNGPVDAWFSGYNPNIVTTTWLGFNKRQTLGSREYGGSAALPIWIDYMSKALKGQPETFLKQPPGLVTILIDEETGERANAGQKNSLFEIFREEYAPKIKAQTIPTQNDSELLEDLF